MHYAVLIENEEIIGMLLLKSANPFLENIDGETAYELSNKKIKEKFKNYKPYDIVDF